jgi:hypothetical protein
VPSKWIKSFVLLQKHCKPPNEISRNFQGNNVYEFREILMTKMRNFVFKNGSTVFVIVTCVYMSLSYTGLLTPRCESYIYVVADASSSFSLDYACHQGRREAINIGGGGLSSCFDQI